MYIMNPMRQKLSAAWDFCVMEVEENIKMWHDIYNTSINIYSARLLAGKALYILDIQKLNLKGNEYGEG